MDPRLKAWDDGGWAGFRQPNGRQNYQSTFYFDPPHSGNEDDYGRAVLSRDDFAELADVLGQIRGRFILSLSAVHLSSKKSIAAICRRRRA
jgi:site-specific DNA-adenine methylase